MRNTGRNGFLSGVVAAALMLLWMLAARLWLGVLTPVELAVDWLVPMLPLSWFEAGLDLLGGLAKPLLYLMALLVNLALGGVVGVVYARLAARSAGPRPQLAGVLLVLALMLFTGLALLPLTGQGVFGASSSAGVARTVAYYLPAYALFTAVLGVSVSLAPSDSGPTDEGRRRMLRRTLRGGAALLAVAAAGPVLARLLERMTLTSVDASAEGMPAPITPVGTFYNVSKNALDPDVDALAWRLRIHGLVERPYSLALEDIHALPASEKVHTLQCISNPVGGNLVGNARWKGLPLRDLLERAGLRDGVVDIKLEGEDGYTDSIPLSKAMEPGTLLVYEMNGAPLTLKHGAPLRLLVPDIYGMKNVKWIRAIEAVGEDYKGYWQRQGWSDVATYQTMSQVRVPAAADVLRVGDAIEVGGIAFAGARGIDKVEWSTDGGRTWQQSDLLLDQGPDTWRFWQAEWKPTQPGEYRLLVRATDGEGRLQAAEPSPTLPSGATGYHGITIRVREGAAASVAASPHPA